MTSAATILVDEFVTTQIVADDAVSSYDTASEAADASAIGGYR